MSEQNEKRATMFKDTLIYMLAKLIEGAVGVLTISAMSYIYEPNEVGKYSTLNIAITTVAMVCIQWLVQSVLRYINKYLIENKQDEFFSTVFSAWFKVNIKVIFACSFAVLFAMFIKADIFVTFFENYPLRLIFSALFMFFSYNTAQLVIALLAGVRKAKLNLFLSIINVTGKLVFIVLFNKFWGKDIAWVFVSYSIFDLLTAFIGSVKLKIHQYAFKKNTSEEILETLKIYGFPLMLNMIATSILNKSDIYIITGVLGDFSAGVYQTNYSIIASAFTLLNAGAMRGSYPTILKTWSEGKIDLTKKLISDAVRMFLLVAVPAVFGVFALSDFVSSVLFEKSYHFGHSIMGFVALGMLFLGLTEYAIKPWELNAKTKAIFKRSLFCGILNIVLNLVLVPKFSFEICAVNTFISFFIYFLLAKFGTKKYITWELKKSVYLKLIFSAFLMCLTLILIKQFFPKNLVSLIILVLIGIFIYFLTLYLTGEIKKEVSSILAKIKQIF